MRRFVILTTLTLLLLAVAGVGAAQDGFFEPGNATDTPGPTDRESTTTKPTLGPPAESTSGVEPPDVNGETTAQGRGQGEGNDPPEQVTDGSENGRNRGAGGADAGEPGGENEGHERPGAGDERGTEPGGESPGGPGAGDGEKEGSGEEKVTICHKGKQTLSVGAPAEPAHLGHGDSLGPC